MTDADSLRFQAIRVDPVRGRVALGEVDLDLAGVLTVVDAPSGTAPLLERLIGLINAKSRLDVPVQAPLHAPPFAQGSRGVRRTDPQFFDALQAFLFKHYGVFLAPAGPIEWAAVPPTELP